MKQVVKLLLVSVLFGGLSGCGGDEFFSVEEQAKADDLLIIDFLEGFSLLDDAIKDEATGIYYIIDVQGAGEKPTYGASILTHYKGFLLTGELFDSSENRGPFDFVIGRGDVIRGWDIGFSFLEKGTQAILFIPSGYAYGQNGSNGIPPNSVLQFEVNLIDIR